MGKNPTPWQRITGATPAFFKKVQVFALGLAGLGSTMASINAVSAKISTALISAGTAVAAIAQFAVKFEESGSTQLTNQPYETK